MKKSEFITKLQAVEGDPEVAIFDWQKNRNDDYGDGSSLGVHTDFEISMVTLETDEAEFYKEQNGRDFVPWLAIGFENEDYKEDAVRTCRVCGCTDNDCSQCIDKTDAPCHWVEEDLCNACVPVEQKSSLLLPGRDF